MRLLRLPPFPLAALAALALSCQGRAHLLEEGHYAFTAAAVLQDDCGLLGPSGALWDADYSVSGNIVRMHYGLHGLFLAGAYFSQPDELFEVDGSAGNLAETLHGTDCLVDRLTVHLEAANDSPTAFHGGLRVRYESYGSQACTCALWATYTAVKQ